MSYGIKKTEHAGAKNGGGAYGKRADVKEDSRHKRRSEERRELLRWLTREAETYPGGYR